MRFLVIGAHPLANSLSVALRSAASDALCSAGHEVDLLDLYAESFAPVLSGTERSRYFETGDNLGDIASHVARLRACDGILLVYPTWWFGFPAILKGYFDRVWVPGVAFERGGAALRPGLRNIRRFGVVTTYGSPWWYIRLVMGDPTRKIVRRGLAQLCAPGCRTLFLAQYGLDTASRSDCEKFLRRVSNRVARF